MCRISVIALAYNLEEYLPACIESVLNQTFQDFELIIINDGSTDNSGDICDSYAAKDERITVIHKENNGIASARNTGIKNANGTYVSFIDCDDWYHPEMLEALYQAARSEKADMVLCNYQEVIDGEPAVHFTSWPAPVLIEKEDALEKLFDDKHTFIVPWNRLYHKSLFSRVTYPERKHYDDEFTAHSFINEAEKIVHIDHDFYFYRIRSSSETRTSMSAKKFDKIEAVSNRLIYLKPHKQLYQKGLVHFHHLFFWYYNQSKGMVEPSVRIRGKACFKKHFIQLLMTNQLTVKEKAASALFYVSDNWYEKLITNKRE